MEEKRFRKGQGLPINVIILAALALVVLIVVLAIFSKGSGQSVKTLQSCKIRGGECRINNCDEGEASMSKLDCKENEICCVKIFKEQK